MPASNEELDPAVMASTLAHLLHFIRPEWSVRSLTSLILANRGHASFPALCEAAVRVARNPVKKTPAVIFMDGPHWVADPVAGVSLPRGPACEDHPEEVALRCRCCLADVKVGERPEEMVGKHFEPGGELA